jgi:hypothetical protein
MGDSLQNSLIPTLSFAPASAGAGTVGLQDVLSGNWRELGTKFGYNYLAHWVGVQSGVTDMILDQADALAGPDMGAVLGSTLAGVGADVMAGQLRNLLGFSL